MKFFLVLIALFLYSGPLFSKELNLKMNQLGKSLEKLYPYVYFEDERQFAVQKNERLIRDELQKMINILKSLKPHFEKKDSSYKVHYQTVLAQLQESRTHFKQNFKLYSRAVFEDALYLCSTCHTHDKLSAKLRLKANNPAFKDLYKKANFHFLTRNYDQSLQDFKNHVRKNLDRISENELDEILDKVLKVELQIQAKQNNFDRLKSYLKDLKKKIPQKQNWIIYKIGKSVEGIKRLESLSKRYSFPLNYKKAKRFAVEVLKINDQQKRNYFINVEEDDKIIYLFFQSQIQTLLTQNQVLNRVPVLLYWLSLAERVLHHSFYISLADVYLKECITQYSFHPYAEKCFKEYDSQVRFSYTGSKGENVPFEIKESLKELKEIIEKANTR